MAELAPVVPQEPISQPPTPMETTVKRESKPRCGVKFTIRATTEPGQPEGTVHYVSIEALLNYGNYVAPKPKPEQKIKEEPKTATPVAAPPAPVDGSAVAAPVDGSAVATPADGSATTSGTATAPAEKKLPPKPEPVPGCQTAREITDIVGDIDPNNIAVMEYIRACIAAKNFTPDDLHLRCPELKDYVDPNNVQNLICDSVTVDRFIDYLEYKYDNPTPAPAPENPKKKRRNDESEEDKGRDKYGNNILAEEDSRRICTITPEIAAKHPEIDFSTHYYGKRYIGRWFPNLATQNPDLWACVDYCHEIEVIAPLLRMAGHFNAGELMVWCMKAITNPLNNKVPDELRRIHGTNKDLTEEDLEKIRKDNGWTLEKKTDPPANVAAAPTEGTEEADDGDEQDDTEQIDDN